MGHQHASITTTISHHRVSKGLALGLVGLALAAAPASARINGNPTSAPPAVDVREPAAVTPGSSGFDWADAGIGAGVGVVLAGLGAGLAVNRRGRTAATVTRPTLGAR